jgi:hypothetical protein
MSEAQAVVAWPIIVASKQTANSNKKRAYI